MIPAAGRARLFVSAVNSVARHLRPERRRHAHRAPASSTGPRGRIGFGAEADGVFTTGGTQSNLQALLLARGQARTRGPSAALRIFASRRQPLQRAEVGARCSASATTPWCRSRPTTARRMDPAALDAGACAALARRPGPDGGRRDRRHDRLRQHRPAGPRSPTSARAHGVWLHVDAAYGGGLLVSPRRRHLLDGIERARLGHGRLPQDLLPAGLARSALSCATRPTTCGTCTWHADYLNPRGRAAQPNQVDKSLQTTRRFDALKLWLTLRTMGADGIGDYFDAVIDLADGGARRCSPRRPRPRGRRRHRS